MTTSATASDLSDSEDLFSYASYTRELMQAIEHGVWERYAEAAGSSLPTRMLFPPCVLRSHGGTADYDVALLQYGGDANAIVIVNFLKNIEKPLSFCGTTGATSSRVNSSQW